MPYGEPVWTIKERQEALRRQYIAYLILQVIGRVFMASVIISVCLLLWVAVFFGLEVATMWITKIIGW